MQVIKFTYITRANGKPMEKIVKAVDYTTALAKFEKWAKTNTKRFCILAEHNV